MVSLFKGLGTNKKGVCKGSGRVLERVCQGTEEGVMGLG